MTPAPEGLLDDTLHTAAAKPKAAQDSANSFLTTLTSFERTFQMGTHVLLNVHGHHRAN